MALAVDERGILQNGPSAMPMLFDVMDMRI